MPSFAAPDGTQLIYDACEPPGPRAAVLWLHGWLEHGRRWTAVGEQLASAGYATYLLDQRGHGRSGGKRGHLSRFSQLLGDLQAFRRAVRRRQAGLIQFLIGHSFGALVALRYLETQPSDPIAAAVMLSPWLGLASAPPTWKLVTGRLLADLWPTLPLPARLDASLLSRDHAVCAAYEADPDVHGVTTPGAWREIQWAQRAVPADGNRIETPMLFLLGGEDRVVDSHAARAFADGLNAPAHVCWYPEMFHELLHDPQHERVMRDLLGFLATHLPPS